MHRSVVHYKSLHRAIEAAAGKRVYAVDLNAAGAKRWYVCGDGAGEVEWLRGQRHAYEVITGKCCVYIDLEYRRDEYDADEMKVLHACIDACHVVCGKGLGFPVLLTSSDDAKVSWHVVFPEGPVFASTRGVGNFVHDVVEQGRMTFPELFYGLNRCVVDTLVYTRNRCFRLWGSAKFGTDRRFRVLGSDLALLDFGAGGNVDEELLRRSMAGIPRADPRSEHRVRVYKAPRMARVGRDIDPSVRLPHLTEWIRGTFGCAHYGLRVLPGRVLSTGLHRRECVIAKRVHRHNHVILCIAMDIGQFWNRCFNQECAKKRTRRQVIRCRKTRLELQRLLRGDRDER